MTGQQHCGKVRSRTLLFALTLITTIAASWALYHALAARDAGGWSVALLPLFVALFIWVAFSFWMATIGFAMRLFESPKSVAPIATVPVEPQSTARSAILMPVYNESPHRVLAGLRAIYESLRAAGQGGAFDFYVLSDSTDPDVWLAEEVTWSRLTQAVDAPIYYRHRPQNTGRKAGNIADFCKRWGYLYRYMIVLDADSVMSAGTLTEMVRRMEEDPAIGILQVPPVPVNRESVFARCQQFAAAVYGPIFLEGFAWWSGSDGNYWGHNAILRVEAFVKSCGLPRLPGLAPLGGEILSHDFVEAALMRRAGYKVCLAQDLDGSYEECPPTLLAFAQRDQRWCQGNLQHIRLIFSAGLHPMSRLHFGMGAMAYLASPLWLLSLLVSFLSVALTTNRGGTDESVAFDLRSDGWALGLFAVTMALLLLPKFWSYLLLLRDPQRLADCGGALMAAASVLLETAVSMLVAPIMMAFHTHFVVSTLLGRRVQWNAQERGEQGQHFLGAVAAHWHQMVIGLLAAWFTWMFAPAMLVWLVPVLCGLVLAIPLSVVLSSVRLGRWLAAHRLLVVSEESAVPQVLERHRYLLALAPPRELTDPKLLRRFAFVDPGFVALHCCILETTGAVRSQSQRRISHAERQVQSGGIKRLSTESCKAILSDPVALRSMHRLVWSMQRA